MCRLSAMSTGDLLPFTKRRRPWPCAGALTVLAFALLSPDLVTAQDAELRGVVTDQSGAVVPGAAVAVVLPATGLRRNVTTDARGRYVIPFLTLGTYAITVELDGFQPVRRAGVVLEAGAQIELDVVLLPAALTEVIEVTGGGTLIDETPGIGLVLDRDLLSNMPLEGRSLQALVRLAPGVVSVGTDGLFSIDGNRTTSNGFTIDGVSANVATPRAPVLAPRAGRRVGPTGDTDTNAAGANASLGGFSGGSDIVQLEAVDQVRVQTAGYSAQYGRQPGGQVQLITRSGTNQFTGSAFEYFRTSALDARDRFTRTVTPRARPSYTQHQFGGVFGGPITRDRTFFFGSYEGRQMGTPQPARQLRVPAERLRNDPALSPVLRQLLAAYPMPHDAEFVDSQGRLLGAAPYYDTSTSIQRSHAYSIKIDGNLGQRLALTGRWNQGVTARTSYMLAQESDNRSHVGTMTVNARSILTSRLLSEFSGNYSRTATDNGTQLMDRLGVTPLGVRDLVPGVAPESSRIRISLPGSVQDYALGPTVANRQVQTNLVENISWNIGRHGLRFGADFRRLTPVYGPTEYSSTVTFNTIESFLSSRADQLSIASFDQVQLAVSSFSAYAQDTFRVNGRLTIDAGLRWEINPAPKGLDKPLFTLQGFPNLTALQLAPAGTPLYRTPWNEVAPRVGGAYRLRQSPAHSTLARASFGLYFDLGTGATATAARMFPYHRSVRRTGVPFPADDGQAAAPAPLSLDPPYMGQDFTIVAPHNVLPRTWQWSSGIEQALGAGQRLAATYTGQAGRRLLRRYFYAFDAVRPVNPSFPSARLNITRNDPGWGDSSDYHALQIQYVRRLSRGLQALANYTFARATDSGSDDATVNLENNATRPTYYYGYSRFDRRHAVNTSVTYNLPSPRTARWLLGGWSTDVSARLQSAAPLTVTYGYTDPVDTITYTYRVDVVAGEPVWLKDPQAIGGRRLNPTAFRVPAGAFGAGSRNQVTHGNEQRNGVRGFGAWYADIVVQKEVRLATRRTLQIRAQAHNVFNHRNVSQPDTSIGTVIGATGQFIPAPLFGRVTQSFGGGGGLGSAVSTGGARTVQLALRVTF